MDNTTPLVHNSAFLENHHPDDDTSNFVIFCIQPGICKFHQNSYHPQVGRAVIFVTFDDMYHYGETVHLTGAGNYEKHECVFFENIDQVRTVYFPEKVKKWKYRSVLNEETKLFDLKFF